MDALARLDIGFCCEKLWEEAVEQSKHDVITRSNGPAVTRMQAEAKSIPVKERKFWFKNVYEKEGYILREDADFERRERAGIDSNADDEIVPYLVTLYPKRPMGVHKDIVKQTTIQAQSRYQDLGITERLVRTCWDEYRAFIRSCNENENDF